MDKECYLNSGIAPAPPSEPAMHSWNPFSLAQQLNSTSELTSAYSFNSNWDNEKDHFTHPSSFTSVTSFTAVPALPVPSNDIGIHNLIAKSGPLCNPGGNLTPFSSGSGLSPAPAVHAGSSGVDTSEFQIMNQFVKESLPNLGGPLNSPPQAFSADPEFAERAAKFSCFGSRSFNSRRSHPSLNYAELPERSNAMARVWSSPSLKQTVSPMENKQFCPMELKKLNELPPMGPNSNESSSISEQAPSGETVSRVSNEIIVSRKRKPSPKNKDKENGSAVAVNSQKIAEADDVKIGKRLKTAEGSPSEKGGINREGEEEDTKDNVNADMQEQHKQDKADQKLPEPPKDYIHVRARRGQATDSHSLAERVRREKIGERMKLLQNLVPGCNKVTGKALMLDEIINYVQSLQRQVEFLSMKLASVDPRQEVDMDNFTSKDTMQQNGSLPCSLYPVDSSVPMFHDHQPKSCPAVHTSSSVSQCPVDPVYKTSCQNLELQLPSLNAFIDGLPQFPVLGEDDLHSIVGMRLSQDAKQEPAFHSMSFPVRNQLHRSP